MNVVADKATWKHRTRQFVMAITMVPDAPELLQTIYLGLPVVKRHCGMDIAESIKTLLDERQLTANQIVGASADGQYIHLGVEECLQSLYGDSLNCHMSWDPMHKAGLVDKHIEKPEFKWMSDVLALCQDLYTQFNWGAAYERYIDAGDEIQEHVTPLTRTCETRFANSKRFVFVKVLENLATIVKCLQDIQLENRDGSSRDRQKACEAASLEGRLLNGKTLLELACLSDIYNIYGELINVCQTVNILPHERLEKVDQVISMMDDMCEACHGHASCQTVRVRTGASKCCLWKHFHKAAQMYQRIGEIQGVVVVDAIPQRGGIGANTTRATRAVEEPSKQELKDTVATKATELMRKLSSDLKDQVYHPEDRALIMETKTITDLETVYSKVQQVGSVQATATMGPAYIHAAKHLVPELTSIDDTILMRQFTVLCEALSSDAVRCGLDAHAKERKSGNKATVSNKLAQLLIKTDLQLYQNCELLVHSLSVAALKFSVESVIESLVSQYEHRFGPKRSVCEETADQEMEVYINGPNLPNCDAVVSAALDVHFGGRRKWHFLHSGSLHSFSLQSNTVRRLMKEPSKFPFLSWFNSLAPGSLNASLDFKLNSEIDGSGTYYGIAIWWMSLAPTDDKLTLV